MNDLIAHLNAEFDKKKATWVPHPEDTESWERECLECRDTFTPSIEHENDMVCDCCVSEGGKTQKHYTIATTVPRFEGTLIDSIVFDFKAPLIKKFPDAEDLDGLEYWTQKDLPNPSGPMVAAAVMFVFWKGPTLKIGESSIPKPERDDESRRVYVSRLGPCRYSFQMYEVEQ